MQTSKNCETCNAEIASQPLLKWLGSKTFLVPKLKPVWERHLKKFPNATLIEPFAGSAAISFGLQPERAILNDLNPHLINLYRWVQMGLENVPVWENDQETYTRARRHFNKLIGDSSRASSKTTALLFLYLNRTCFRGVCRFNRQGKFNVPFGFRKSVHFHENYSGYKKLFEGWRLLSKDFSEVPAKPGDLVFIDSPYDMTFVDYTSLGFDWKDQVRLAEWASSMADMGATVICTNSNSDRIRQLYAERHFRITTISAPRKIDIAGDRTPAIELCMARLV